MATLTWGANFRENKACAQWEINNKFFIIITIIIIIAGIFSAEILQNKYGNCPVFAFLIQT